MLRSVTNFVISKTMRQKAISYNAPSPPARAAGTIATYQRLWMHHKKSPQLHKQRHNVNEFAVPLFIAFLQWHANILAACS